MIIKYFNIWIVVIIMFFGFESYSQSRIIINIQHQKLYLLEDSDTIADYDISSAKAGIGSNMGSFKTPLGKHKVVNKIGEGLPIGAIFIAREFTGKIAKIYHDNTDVDEDWILTRIIQIRGLEPGINLGGNVDSYRRRIYIHGTNEEGLIGVPASHGCIRMKNNDMIKLFNNTSTNTIVDIVER